MSGTVANGDVARRQHRWLEDEVQSKRTKYRGRKERNTRKGAVAKENAGLCMTPINAISLHGQQRGGLPHQTDITTWPQLSNSSARFIQNHCNR